MTESLFLGKPYQYWIEMEQHALDFDVTRLIGENAKLRAKVSCYETHIRQMNQYKETVEGL